jgi:hypothetical protein
MVNNLFAVVLVRFGILLAGNLLKWQRKKGCGARSNTGSEPGTNEQLQKDNILTREAHISSITKGL